MFLYIQLRECASAKYGVMVSKENNLFKGSTSFDPAFAFTDYKCQGQTLGKVVVDLNEGTSAGIYVMLSRVQRMED
jgi:hypothetical protein